MKYIRILSIVLLVFLNLECFAQQHYQLKYRCDKCVLTYSFYSINDSTFIYGRLSEKKTNDPVTDINILLKGFRIGTVSNLQGEFRLFLPVKEGVLSFDKTGFDKFDLPYKVTTSELLPPPASKTPFSHQN